MLRPLGNPYYNAPLRPVYSTFKLILAHRGSTVHTLGGYIVKYAPREYAVLIADIVLLTCTSTCIHSKPSRITGGRLLYLPAEFRVLNPSDSILTFKQ